MRLFGNFLDGKKGETIKKRLMIYTTRTMRIVVLSFTLILGSIALAFMLSQTKKVQMNQNAFVEKTKDVATGCSSMSQGLYDEANKMHEIVEQFTVV